MNVAHVLVAVLLTVMMALVVYNSSELHGRQTNAEFTRPVNQLETKTQFTAETVN